MIINQLISLSSLSLFVITVRNSSCGKVMFSQACVKNSVHKRDGHGSGRYASYWNAFLFHNLPSSGMMGSDVATIIKIHMPHF